VETLRPGRPDCNSVVTLKSVLTASGSLLYPVRRQGSVSPQSRVGERHSAGKQRLFAIVQHLATTETPGKSCNIERKTGRNSGYEWLTKSGA
jgi:hypothetical protein